MLAWTNQTGGSEALTYRQNNGSGTFGTVLYTSSPFSGIAAASQFYNASRTYVADFDKDGDMDIWDYAGSTLNRAYPVVSQ